MTLLIALTLGVNLSQHFGEGEGVAIPLEGFSVIRTDLPRDHIEKADGSYDWGPYDRGYEAIRGRGMRVLWVVSLNWVDAGFARFFWTAVGRYPDALFELGNEENLRMPPEAYIEILESLGPGRLPIISAGIGGGVWDEAWLTAAIAAGLADRVDAIGIHPYGLQPHELGGAIARLRQRCALPILITEWGRPSLESEEVQAEFYRLALGAAREARVPLFIAYSLIDRPDHPGPETERHFGLFRADGTPKASHRELK